MVYNEQQQQQQLLVIMCSYKAVYIVNGRAQYRDRLIDNLSGYPVNLLMKSNMCRPLCKYNMIEQIHIPYQANECKRV